LEATLNKILLISMFLELKQMLIVSELKYFTGHDFLFSLFVVPFINLGEGDLAVLLVLSSPSAQ
jgi:hypothetical protein